MGTEDNVTAIQAILEHPEDHGIPRWMLNRRRDIKEGKFLHLASTALDSYIREDVERMKRMKLHRGLRHYWNLKVRGQMTKNTGRGLPEVTISRKDNTHNLALYIFWIGR